MSKASLLPVRFDARMRMWCAAVGSVILWGLIGLLTVVFSLAIMACFPLACLFDPQRRSLHWLASLWGRSIILCNPSWRLTVIGREHLKPHHAYVLVANHQSLLDIMALFALRRQFKWIAKAELFRIPFLGWAMSLAGYVQLARGRHGSVRETYDRTRRWLASGVSVLFFPEGTRSHTGELGVFKNGAFKLAMDTAHPVAPIVVTGTRDLLMKGSWMFRAGSRVQITILPPITLSTYRTWEPERLRDEVRRRIATTLPPLSPAA